MRSWRSTRPACDPTGIRWPAGCSWNGPAESLDEPAFDGATTTLGDELLAPSVIYAPAIAAIRREVDVRSIAHITGGGIPGNLNRALAAAPRRRRSTPDRGSRPRIFGELAALGEVSDEEMANVFNLGVGMIVVVAEEQVGATIEAAATTGRGARRIGRVDPGRPAASG